MGRGTSAGDDREGGARRDSIQVERAKRVLASIRLLRAAGLLGERNGREFDLLLVALRAGPAQPAIAAQRLGVTSDRLRPQITRALAHPTRKNLLYRDSEGRYRLSPTGARRADTVSVSLRRLVRA